MTTAAVSHRILDNLPVEAFKHPLGESFLGGPVLRSDELSRLRHKRHDQACDRFDERARFDRHLEGEWIYIGPKYPHFGHILAEMVHRILPSKLLFPNLKNYLIVTTSDDQEDTGIEALCTTYREVLDFFEIDADSVFILNENAIVERLALCEQGSNLGGTPNPWYLQALRDYTTRKLDQIHGSANYYPKVYVTKSSIPHGGKILGSRYVEELLEEEGFFIFHPENAPLATQMDIYRKADVVIFEEGSACHGTELLGEKMLKQTSVVLRRKGFGAGFSRILTPRSARCDAFADTFFLGTVVVNAEKNFLHTEFGISLFDLDRLVGFFRDRQLAQLPGIDIRRYFEAAENDLREYFQYHQQTEIEEADLWQAGEIRLEFEKLRMQYLGSRLQVPLGIVSFFSAEGADAEMIGKRAWKVHSSGQWLEAARMWEEYRQRFPHQPEGFTLGSVVLIELGRFYEADAILKLAMERFPLEPEIFNNYALVAHHRRDWREAVTRWEQFRERYPQEKAAYSLGANALCELERYSEADDLVSLGLQYFPNEEELLETKAWIAQHAGDRKEATLRWKQLRAEHPENLAAARFCQENPA